MWREGSGGKLVVVLRRERANVESETIERLSLYTVLRQSAYVIMAFRCVFGVYDVG